MLIFGSLVLRGQDIMPLHLPDNRQTVDHILPARRCHRPGFHDLLILTARRSVSSSSSVSSSQLFGFWSLSMPAPPLHKIPVFTPLSCALPPVLYRHSEDPKIRIEPVSKTRQHLLPGYYSTLPFPVQFTSPFVFNMFKIAKKEPPPAGERLLDQYRLNSPVFPPGIRPGECTGYGHCRPGNVPCRPGSPLFQYRR